MRHQYIRTAAYNHELILTRDELPDIMDYLQVAGEDSALPSKSNE